MVTEHILAEILSSPFKPHWLNCVYQAHILEDIYYTVAQRYEYDYRVVKTILYEQAQRVTKILFLTREINIHIFKLPFIFSDYMEVNTS